MAGLYQFSATVGAKPSGTHFHTFCNIIRNGGPSLGIMETVAKPEGYDQASVSLYLELHLGDTVLLKCVNWEHVERNVASMFSGALISK